jgi:hypothetical protein
MKSKKKEEERRKERKIETCINNTQSIEQRKKEKAQL